MQPVERIHGATRRELLAAGGGLLAAALLAPDAVAGRLVRAGRQGSTAAAVAHTFLSRPDLRPPTVEITRADRSPSGGLVFLTPFTLPNPPSDEAAGLLIVDARGTPVWFRPVSGRTTAVDLRVQQLRGQSVLTWWEGVVFGGYGGSWVVADRRYRPIARIRAGNGYKGDLHDLLLTTRGTALLTIYNEVKHDLTAIGGPADGRLVEGIVQEIDVRSGKVLLEWHSLDHVALEETHEPQVTPDGNVDYFHLNSIGVDADGHLLLSARHTSAVYKVHRRTGQVLWRLGGKRSDFALGPGVAFGYQHDARRRPDGTLTLFDNALSLPTQKEGTSRAIRLRLDERRRTARLVRAYGAGARLGWAMGNAQQVRDGGMFVGWGMDPSFTEIGPKGIVRLDGRFVGRSVSYRAYRAPWVGVPSTPPDVTTATLANGATAVYASWNGATEVRRWRILAGSTRNDLRVVRTVPRRGFETAAAVPGLPSYVAAVALDAAGRELGRSAVTRA